MTHTVKHVGRDWDIALIGGPMDGDVVPWLYTKGRPVPEFVYAALAAQPRGACN